MQVIYVTGLGSAKSLRYDTLEIDSICLLPYIFGSSSNSNHSNNIY